MTMPDHVGARLGLLLSALLLSVAYAMGGCSSSGSFDASSPSAGAGAPTGGGSSGGGGGANVGASSGSSSGGLPPEIKTESTYQSPVATGRIVWTANPTSGRVAYVDAVTFGVQTVQAGDGPTYLAAVPSTDPSPTSEAAIVINVRSQNATLLRRDVQSDAQSGLRSTTFPSTADANSWAMSPSGRWAIAWTNSALVTNADATQSFQDIAVLDLTAATTGSLGTAAMLNVGYRPSQIVFSKDELHAFAVTQDGISVIDLGGVPAATRLYVISSPAGADASAPDASPADASDAGGGDAAAPDGSAPTPAGTATPGAPDVSFTADGAYALVRRDGVAAITVVALDDGSLTQVALPSAPTDLTVAPDGTFAVAVLRDSSTVAFLPLPGITTDPSSYTTTVIAGETVGRAIVAEDVTTGPTPGPASVLLFTTVGGIDRFTVLTLGPSPSVRTIALHAPIVAVFPTPDAANAIVLHSVTAAPGSAVQGAFSIVPVASDLPAKIVSLTAPPTAVALAPTSDRALVAVSDDRSIFAVELAMMPSLEVVPFTLASPPTAVGIAAAAGPGGTGFVAQNDPDGRITFIDLSQATARTITGFELGARVVEGSQP
jgi:hypothetical protein